MIPNTEQIKSFIGVLIATFGGAIAGWFAARGWFSVDQVLSVLNSEVVMGLLVSGVVAVWRFFVHTDKNAVAVVDALAKSPDSPVKGVVVAPTPEGKALAESLPGATTAPAGTPQAVAIANGR